MANKKVIIEDEKGDKLYPHTLTECVFDRSGVALEDRLENLDTSWEGVTGKPSTFPPSTHEHSKIENLTSSGALDGTHIYSQYHNSNYFDIKSSNGIPTRTNQAINADTVDGLHASDFVSVAGNSRILRGGGQFTDPGNNWGLQLINTIDTSTENGLYLCTRYASPLIDALRVDTLWNNGYAPATHFKVKGDGWTYASKMSIGSISNVEGEINSLKSSVSSGKTAVANAITAKGVATSTTAEFATMASNIGKIQTSFNRVTTNTTTLSLSVPTSLFVTSKFPWEGSGEYVEIGYRPFVYLTLSVSLNCTFVADGTIYFLNDSGSWTEKSGRFTYSGVSNRKIYNPNKCSIKLSGTSGGASGDDTVKAYDMLFTN